MSRSELMIQYFNKVAGARALEINDIPLDVFIFLNTLSNFEMAKPFIVNDLQNGKSIRRTSRLYKIGKMRIEVLKKAVIQQAQCQ